MDLEVFVMAMGRKWVVALAIPVAFGLALSISGCSYHSSQGTETPQIDRQQVVLFPPGLSQETICVDGTYFSSGYDNRFQCSNHGGVRESEKVFTQESQFASDSNVSIGGGYTVMCNDGSYSPSGGKQGACSHHGGVND